MTSERTITLPVELQELKAATRSLVRAYGGQEAAARRLGTRQQRVSDCCSRNTDAFLRLDEIAILEAETVGLPGHPHVTCVMARQNDRELVETPTIAATGRDLLRLFAQTSKSNSDLAEAVLAAHQDDVITAQEAAQIEDAISDMIATGLTIRSEVRMIQRENRQ